MTIRTQQVNSTGIRVFMGTITDSMSVHEAIATVAKQHGITTGTFELLGGLYRVELAAYDFVQQKRLEAIIVERPMEIIAGHGTLSLLDDELRVHLHLTLAYRDETSATGIQVIGGHAAQASAFAVEFTLTAYDGKPMKRQFHEGTGLQLWNPA